MTTSRDWDRELLGVDNLEYRPGLGEVPHRPERVVSRDKPASPVNGTVRRKRVRAINRTKALTSVSLAYFIRGLTMVLSITLGLVGSVFVIICSLALTCVLLLVKPVEWLQRIRQNATGK